MNGGRTEKENTGQDKPRAFGVSMRTVLFFFPMVQIEKELSLRMLTKILILELEPQSRIEFLF